MTRSTDDLYPKDYDRWPRSVQRQYIAELYALYFPDRVQQAQALAAPQPGDDDAVHAETAVED